MITSADVLLVAPELTVVTAPQWTRIISNVYLSLTGDSTGARASPIWGVRLDLGATYLAAHIATIGPVRGQVGPGGITKVEQVGTVRREFQVPDADDNQLETTPYGKEFKRLMRTLPFRVVAL